MSDQHPPATPTSDSSIHHFSEDSTFGHVSDVSVGFDDEVPLDPSSVLPTPITSPVTAPLNPPTPSPTRSPAPRSPINIGFGTPPTSPPHVPERVPNILELDIDNTDTGLDNTELVLDNTEKVPRNTEMVPKNTDMTPNNTVTHNADITEMVPNNATVNELNKPFIPMQSCYCVVCLKCFFCRKSYSKLSNNHCLCQDTLIPKLPKTEPDNSNLMNTNVYKRAYIIDWVKRHADKDVYDLSTGFHIVDGEIVPIPLCDEHQAQFTQDWNNHEDFLHGLGIMVLDDMTEDQLESGYTPCTFRFRGWETNRPTNIRYLDLPQRAGLEQLFLLTDTAADTFGRRFQEYFDELGMTDEEYGNLRFYDELSNIVYGPQDDMIDAYRHDGIMNRTFDVGLQTTGVKRWRDDDEDPKEEEAKRMKGVKHLFSE